MNIKNKFNLIIFWVLGFGFGVWGIGDWGLGTGNSGVAAPGQAKIIAPLQKGARLAP
jgi:hypothetical protein